MPGKTFVFDGVCIEDPFYDESMRFTVDPVSYYGEAFLSSLSVEEIEELISLGRISRRSVEEFYNNQWWNETP